MQIKSPTVDVIRKESISSINSDSTDSIYHNEMYSICSSECETTQNNKPVIKKITTKLSPICLQTKFDKFLEHILEMMLEKNIICFDSKVNIIIINVVLILYNNV